MTKRIISLIMAIVFVVCLVPASAFSAFAEATVIETKWSNGAVGGPTNNNKYKFISNDNYRTSDIITIEKAGTKVYYTAPTKAGIGHTLLAVSVWVQQNGEWVIDKAAANVDGTFAYGKSIGQTVVDGGIRYEFITDKDNQSIRFSYAADGDGSTPVIYAEPTTEPSTLAQLNARNFTATFDANGTIGNLQWFCGYASSASNTNGSAKEVRHASAAYAFSGLINVPKKGTKITYSSGSYNTAFNAFTRYKLEGGRYVYDVGFDAGNTIVKNGSTYTYVTEYDNEIIRLCVKADKGYSDIAVDAPVTVKWEQTNEAGTASGNKELKTEWPDPELLSMVTGAPLIATSEVKGLEWHDGYVGSQYHDSQAFNITSPSNQDYDYSDVFTVPKAGTTVYFFDQTFTDFDGSSYASTSVMTISHWKKEGSNWVFDKSKEYLNGCDVYNVLMTEKYRLYSYTTTEDNENLRICMRYAPVYSTEEELIPPVYLVEPTDFKTVDKTGEASYTDQSGEKVTYNIYLPADYTTDKQYTLVFDNSADSAIANALIKKNYKGIVLSYAGDLDKSLRLFDEVVKHYPIKVSDFLFVGDEKLAKHAVEFEVIRLCQAMVVTSNNVPSAKYASLKAMSEFKDAEEAALWLVGETEDYYDVLEGVKMYAIGDSYFGGSQLGQHQTWVNLLGYKYGMTFHNYGIGGNTVATARGQSGNQPPMHTRYDQMPTDGDIYIIEGGRNDRHYSVPFGQNDGKTVTSFKGALNVIIQGIQAKNPDALIVLVTAWSNLGESGYLGTNNDYADAMKELAEYYNDPHVVCMYAADTEYTGVDMADAKFRAKYCQTASDVSHLNADGMYLVAPKFDQWLAETYAKFKGAALTNSADAEQFIEVIEESETTAAIETEAPTATEPTTEPAPEKKGCGGMIAGGVAIIALLGTAIVIKKKD
ncbi:MAG: SGNH/GDSL hydrolase family protein [Clostridia bacterium]|nr:SGNH/GDSL hydrolase family protein [Clostridia bacterium]